jgi:hypothetical protein
MGWEKIGVLIIAGVFLLFFAPRALRAAKNSPKATASDWKAFAIPIILVILFVVFLIMSVR